MPDQVGHDGCRIAGLTVVVIAGLTVVVIAGLTVVVIAGLTGNLIDLHILHHYSISPPPA